VRAPRQHGIPTLTAGASAWRFTDRINRAAGIALAFRRQQQIGFIASFDIGKRPLARFIWRTWLIGFIDGGLRYQ
jgi:hypothetical protein